MARTRGTSNPALERGWAEAQRRCGLSDEALRMAKELGLNRANLIKNVPSPKQRWQAPVEDWVRGMYRRRYGSAPPLGRATGRPDVSQNAQR